MRGARDVFNPYFGLGDDIPTGLADTLAPALGLPNGTGDRD
jgi:hypothetical protein